MRNRVHLSCQQAGRKHKAVMDTTQMKYILVKEDRWLCHKFETQLIDIILWSPCKHEIYRANANQTDSPPALL